MDTNRELSFCLFEKKIDDFIKKIDHFPLFSTLFHSFPLFSTVFHPFPFLFSYNMFIATCFLAGQAFGPRAGFDVEFRRMGSIFGG